MAVIESAAGNAVDSSGPLTCTAPTGTQSGDLLVAVYTTSQTSGGQTTSVSSSGWTTEAFWNNGGDAQIPASAVLWKLAGGSEPSSYSFSRTGSPQDNQIVHIMRVSGADLDDPFAVVPDVLDQSSGGNPVPAPGFTNTVDGALGISSHIAMFWDGSFGSDRWTSNSTGAEVLDYSGNWAHMGTYSRILEAGVYPDWEATLYQTPNQEGRGISFAIRPVGSQPSGPAPNRFFLAG